MTRAGGFLLAAGALTLPLWLQSPYHLHVAIMAGIFGVLAMSLNLLLGYTGRLARPPFFGIGAYAGGVAHAQARLVVLPALAPP
jgi:branched-chain amino acid transport system permease protein